jgi:hypothetical protein
MARTRKSIAGSAAAEVQQQARALLQTLQKEIRQREEELAQMKRDASSLSGLAGIGVRAVRTAAQAGSGRINWRQILEQLPKKFKASDIRSLSGLQHKRPSEIFAAITRWMEAGMVKRRERGIYERV